MGGACLHTVGRKAAGNSPRATRSEGTKVERLRGPRVFEAVRTGGKVFDGLVLRFFYDLHLGEKTSIGFGIVMGKRHGSAVVRNRLKRRIRAACREVLGCRVKMPDRLTLSVVVVFKGSRGHPASRLSYAEILNDMANLGHAIQTSAAEINGTRADLSGP